MTPLRNQLMSSLGLASRYLITVSRYTAIRKSRLSALVKLAGWDFLGGIGNRCGVV